MKDRSDDPLHHERTPFPRSYISLPLLSKPPHVLSPDSLSISFKVSKFQSFTHISTKPLKTGSKVEPNETQYVSARLSTLQLNSVNISYNYTTYTYIAYNYTPYTYISYNYTPYTYISYNYTMISTLDCTLFYFVFLSDCPMIKRSGVSLSLYYLDIRLR